jgi:hypothetical protein
MNTVNCILFRPILVCYGYCNKYPKVDALKQQMCGLTVSEN